MIERLNEIEKIYTYDELTIRSDGSRNPFTLIREFEQSGYTKYDAQYMMVFLAGIMDTYVGCDVLLSDGRVGTIIFINKSDISRPMVKCGDEYISLWKTNAITIEKFV